MEIERYTAMMEDIYRFVLYANDDYNAPKDYGTGKVLNMVQMHTLAMIADNPGICVTDVAKMWNRTLGAASKNVNRLCAKGYVEKKKLPDNDKTVHLFPTQEGMHLAVLHKKYDCEQIMATVNTLLAYHTEEELESFYQVLLTCIKIFEKYNGKLPEDDSSRICQTSQRKDDF